MKRKITVFLLLALLLTSVLAGCGGTEEAAEEVEDAVEEVVETDEPAEEEEEEEVAVDGDRPFVVGTAEFSGDFHNGWSNSSYDNNIRKLVWGYGLMMSTPEGDLVDSHLVEEKTVSDDLYEWTFKLKEGLEFHNGEELSASDVKFTYDFYMDTEPLGATGATSNLGDYVADIEVVDEQTVKFTLEKPIYTVDLDVFMTYILAEDTITAGAEAEGFNVQEYVKAHISEPIGYGPYKLVEYADSEYVILEANQDHVGVVPAIDELIVKYTPSETELDQLLQGEVDLLHEQVEAEKIDAAKADANFQYNNYFRHGGGSIVLHTDFDATQLTEVRQAFAYLLNRPKIIELFLGEYGIASNGPYSKNDWMMYDDDEMDIFATEAVGKFEATLNNYDIVNEDGSFDEEANIAKAHELLDAAVAKTDGAYAMLTGNAADGYMWDGEPMVLKITYTDFWADTYNIVWNDEYVSKLGFDVQLTGLDWPVMYGHWIGDTAEEREYHAYVGGISYALKSNPRLDYSTKEILPWGQPSNNGPRFSGGSSYTPEEWDQLLADIENADPLTGRDEYRENWRKYITVMNEEVPIIPVYSNNYHDLYTIDLENFETNALWDWPMAIVNANWAN